MTKLTELNAPAEDVAHADTGLMSAKINALTAELSQAKEQLIDWNMAAGYGAGPGDYTPEELIAARQADWKARDDARAELSQAQAELDAERIKAHGRGVALSETMAELAALRAGAPDGWRLVPVQATPEMEAAGWIDKEDVCPCEIYAAMLAAAPQPPAQAVAVRVKPLVWGEYPYPAFAGPHVKASTGAFGAQYVAQRNPYGKGYIAARSEIEIPCQTSAELLTLEAAMVEAQAMENYVLSAIDARPEAAVKAEALRERNDQIMTAAIQEYHMHDNLAGEREQAARRAAVRGLMVRLSLYGEFCAEADRLEKEGAS